jgi:hypothetical protein
MGLDVENWGNANGTPVSLYWADHTSNQQWLVQAQDDGTYKIYAYSGRNSVQTLDYANGNTGNGTAVRTWEDNGNNAQRWYFLDVGGGYWRIVPKNAWGTSQTLDISGGNGAGLGARTIIWSYWGGNNQVFRLDDPGPILPAAGVYRLTTRGQLSMGLDVENLGNANGTPVSLYWANHTSNQQWLVQAQVDRTYKIYAYSGQNSLQMLDYANGNTSNGTAVRTWEDNGNNAQRWYFMDMGGGYWRIVPRNAGGTSQTLDISGGNGAGLGSRTIIWSYWGGNNQVFRLDDPGPPAILPSPKKGLAGYPNEIGAIHPSWIYTWGGDRPAGIPANVEFVPMAWGYYGNGGNNFVNWLNRVTSQTGVRNLMGFNEPDSPSQSNLTVAAALDGWQYMVRTSVPLLSPAAVHADNQWMRDFMAGASQRGYRVDYVAIHWYGGNDPNGFLGYVNYIHNLYNKPVWITEFAPADWSGHHGISSQQAYDFMRQVVPELNRRSYVQRYSWFSAGTGDPFLGQSALFNSDGSRTTLGNLYARM